jgi:hypothetical protein
MALTEDNCSVDVQPKRFELKYGNKQARSLYTGQRNLYAQAAQYIQNTHRTARVDEVTDGTGSGACGQQGERHSGAKQAK